MNENLKAVLQFMNDNAFGIFVLCMVIICYIGDAVNTWANRPRN